MGSLANEFSIMDEIFDYWEWRRDDDGIEGFDSKMHSTDVLDWVRIFNSGQVNK